MKKLSKKFSLVLILTLLISTVICLNLNVTSACASTNGLTITQVGDTKNYGGGYYKAINMHRVSYSNTVNTTCASVQFRLPSYYHTGTILRVNGSFVTDNPKILGFSNDGDYCYITIAVPDLDPNMSNRVEIIDGGVYCPQVSDSVYITVA